MQKIYAAYHKNTEEVEKSSSGAMFAAISDLILKQNGKIIGGGYNYVTNQMEHIICSSPTERDACRGSKYIQSCINGNIYKVLEEELNKHTPLLFIGMPCQVVAIKQYIEIKKIDSTSLLTCDILCHGVGSPGVWDKFLIWKNKKIDYITFKDKRNGWKSPLCIAKSNGKEFSIRGYSWLYFSNLIMRPSCYECPFSTKNRVGDLTIGDFWKVKSKCPEMYNPRGTSFITINTFKGQECFNQIKNSIVYKEISLDDVLQNNMQHPSIKPKWRAEVMRDYKAMKPATFFTKWEIILFANKLLKKFVN